MMGLGWLCFLVNNQRAALTSGMVVMIPILACAAGETIVLQVGNVLLDLLLEVLGHGRDFAAKQLDRLARSGAQGLPDEFQAKGVVAVQFGPQLFQGGVVDSGGAGVENAGGQFVKENGELASDAAAAVERGGADDRHPLAIGGEGREMGQPAWGVEMMEDLFGDEVVKEGFVRA